MFKAIVKQRMRHLDMEDLKAFQLLISCTTHFLVFRKLPVSSSCCSEFVSCKHQNLLILHPKAKLYNPTLKSSI